MGFVPMKLSLLIGVDLALLGYYEEGGLRLTSRRVTAILCFAAQNGVPKNPSGMPANDRAGS